MRQENYIMKMYIQKNLLQMFWNAEKVKKDTRSFWTRLLFIRKAVDSRVIWEHWIRLKFWMSRKRMERSSIIQKKRLKQAVMLPERLTGTEDLT